MIGFIFAWWWLLLVESLIVAVVIGLLALNAHRLIGGTPRGLMALKSSMALTAFATFIGYVALIVGVSRLIASYTGSTASANMIVYGAIVLSIILIGLQWLFSPYLINLFYRTRPPETREELMLQDELRRIAEASGIKPPRLRIADLAMPNAFAYGSPIAGSYVAVTRGLLRLMPPEEVRAVLGHEVGHLKHRDVSWLLALSLVPLAIYFIGRTLIWSGFLGGDSRERNSPMLLVAIGAALIAASILFRFLVAHFNRLREYYADAHGAMVSGSPRYMQRALARLDYAFRRDQSLVEEARNSQMAAMLFIVAPLIELSGGFLYDIDAYVDRLKNTEPSPIEELFSTHPPIPKRLRFLDRLALYRE